MPNTRIENVAMRAFGFYRCQLSLARKTFQTCGPRFFASPACALRVRGHYSERQPAMPLPKGFGNVSRDPVNPSFKRKARSTEPEENKAKAFTADRR